MIKIVTKDYFWDHVKKESGFDIRFIPECDIMGELYPSIIYFEQSGKGLFACIPGINRLYIPKGVEIDRPEKDAIDISSWELQKVSEKPKYILNVFSLGNTRFSIKKENDIFSSGDWILINRETGEILEFSLNGTESWNKEEMYYKIAIEELTDIPIKQKFCKNKLEFIRYILTWMIRKN